MRTNQTLRAASESLSEKGSAPFRIGSERSLLLITMIGFVAAVMIPCGGCRRQRSKEEMLSGLPPELRQQLTDPSYSTPAMVAGIEFPQFVSAESSGLGDGQEVIGVVIHGQPRAYPLSKMMGIAEHVINDSVVDDAGDTRPFTVTFCDLTACSRVFQATDDRLGHSLAVHTLGLLEGGLGLRWEGQHFKQADGAAGLHQLPHERMRWDQWKLQHPETLVYAGANLTGRRVADAHLPTDVTVPGP
jgi:hypothetical protein